MAYLQVVGGLILLVLAGEFLVRGAASLARRLNVSTMVIGLTVVAFGTSAPELVVAIDAVLTGAPTLALGNVVGSNIANVWLVLGLPAIMVPMVCTTPKFTQSLLIMLAVTILFIGLGFLGEINWYIGIGLIALLAAFVFTSNRDREDIENFELALEDIEGDLKQPDPAWFAGVLVLGGIAGLALGGHVLVKGSVEIARDLGVSEATIGLTIVAIGTSIPELVTAIIATLRNHCNVALGNVIGSNIFNLLGIVGVASMFGTIPVPIEVRNFDLWIMLLAAMTLIPFALFRLRIDRRIGIGFLITYVAYILVLAHDALRTNGLENGGL